MFGLLSRKHHIEVIYFFPVLAKCVFSANKIIFLQLLKKTYVDTMKWPGMCDLCISAPSIPSCLPVGVDIQVKYGLHVNFAVEFSYMCWEKVVETVVHVFL
jgi:hypothetical protein